MSILAVLALLYIVLWFILVYPICNILNNVNNRNENNTQEQPKFSFTSISPHGFPLFLGLRINNLRENQESVEISLSHPLYLEYSLFTGVVHIKYDGEIISRYKISTDQFDSIINIDKMAYSFAIPFTWKNISRLRHDPTDLINAIHSVDYRHSALVVRNKFSNEMLYESGEQFINLTKQDTRVELDLRKNLPQSIAMEYKINNKSYVDFERLPAPTSMLYGAFIPISICSNGSITLSTHGQAISDFYRDYRLQYSGIVDINLLKFDGQISYETSSTKHAFYTKMNLEIKNNFFDTAYRIISLVKYLNARTKNRYDFDISSIEKFDSKEYKILEGRSYQVDAMLSIINQSLDVLTVSCINNKNGIYLNCKPQENKSERVDNRKDYEVNLGINNANKIVSLLTKLITPQNINAKLTEIERDIFAKANYFFLKSISEYPKSQSDNFLISGYWSGEKIKVNDKPLSEILPLYDFALDEGITTHITDEDERRKTHEHLIHILMNWGMELAKSRRQ
ncbi:hypothetical protein [Candidatus Sarmatiella mevalonica]|uniref:hypothetical protein n=1 Tax=Candidatus Sarmatiella mevalonica TaxID=2770581 RepID=UPI0019215629|nr:hypothetical protein [Candidatus Sarmatiella mevalonica]